MNYASESNVCVAPDLLECFVCHRWLQVHMPWTTEGSRLVPRGGPWVGRVTWQRKGRPGLGGAGTDLGGRGHSRKHPSAHPPCTSLPLLSICLLTLSKVWKKDSWWPQKWNCKRLWRTLYIQPHYFNGSEGGKEVGKKDRNALNRRGMAGADDPIHIVTQRR